MKHNLMLGDCLERMKEIETGTVDMILCDLPYGTTCCSWDAVIPFEPLWEQYERVIKENGAIVLFAAHPFTAVLATSNLKLFRYEWIWEKPAATGFFNAQFQPLRAHENILVFYKAKPTFNPMKTFGHERKTAKRKDIGSEHYGKQVNIKSYDSTERYPRSVQLFSSDKQKANFHPTQKPVALCEYLIRTYTNEGETVLDNTMGSGTTGVACVNTGRSFIGIEQEQKYFEIAQERIAQAGTEKDMQPDLFGEAV
ncbi:DNA methylase family protein [Acinetobacter baumannii UH7607]|nr:site-specific DNA-methyltransferase [Acinetobacter nosocomialis]ETQ16936.1 DNA methylase family protein [Acinetobacter baumannii UH12208]ETQ47121.1 DNA methylase family protein [Acinetobacter baumannii UH19608]ETQ47388.1 DNA methylase family protein [Acinetobacter baumannii UH16208]ETQ63483.1 DNA methylase family protein [Acinetobacter baumannii UH22908]ETR05328.1 DNA methylase family protein [Acinetobacter baumannii UH6907]ETR09677.1 DNA methylase family protein [Acinetobacter baumannii U